MTSSSTRSGGIRTSSCPRRIEACGCTSASSAGLSDECLMTDGDRREIAEARRDCLHRRLLLCGLSVALRSIVAFARRIRPPAARRAASAAAPKSPERALLDQYCVTCHNQRAKTANITFDTLDLAHLSDHADVWEKAVRKLRGGMMPPPGVRRPDQAAVDGLVSWLERSLDQAAAANPNPGRVALHRLNRAEYANAIEDLLGLRIDASAFLPQDDEADGFDNVASVLKVSPSFLDQYISAARVVSTRAIGNPSPQAGQRDLPSAARHRSERARRRSAAGHPRRTAGRASVSGRRRIQVEHRRSRRLPVTCAAWSIATRSSPRSTAPRSSRRRSAARKT